MSKLLLLIIALGPPGLLAQDPLDEAVEILETEQMLRLAAQQNRPGISIDPFRSDGCSGGMSQAWSYLSENLPEFARYAGNKPPWEHCCVEHDRHYWRGETENGFRKRKQADADLRQCVRETGTRRADEIAETLQLPRQDIIETINLTADLMYQAVRVGGAPCTGLPWRWGHGWPPCSDKIEPGNGPETVTTQLDGTL